MDFSEFCESLEDPIYVGEEKVTCRKGYKYDKKLGQCVPEANAKKTDKQNPGESQLPEPLGGWNTWGATGMNGDGYALAVEEEKEYGDDPKKWPSIKDEKKTKKAKYKYDPHMKVNAPNIQEDVPYHRTAKDERRMQDAERKHRDDDNRMRYGKKGKEHHEKTALRPGEVKHWDKNQNRWVSNKEGK